MERSFPINIQLNIPLTSSFGRRFLLMREIGTVISAAFILNKWSKSVRGVK